MAMHALHAPVSALIRQVASEIVLPRFRNLRAEDISEKTKDDFVTIADKESEAMLSEGLTKILPDAGVVGEEAAAADRTILTHSGEGLKWIIDPVDGTNNFASGNPPFGIIVALSDNGSTLAGWLYDPLSGRMCHAALGGGAYVNDERVTAKETGAPLPIAAIATHFLTAEQRAQVIADCAGHFECVDIPRCAAEQYPRLILGTNDVAVFERSLPWDHAAGILLVNEAGGKVARRDGDAYRVGDTRKGLIGASSPRIWDQARAIFTH